MLAVIYAADEKDDWRRSATWKKANPGYGVTIKPEYLRAECKRAIETPGYENTFKRLHLNLWTEQASRWLAMERWDACAPGAQLYASVGALLGPARAQAIRRELMLALRGRECFAGLDLAATTDLNALVLDFPIPDLVPGAHIWLPFFWMPEENVALRLRRDRVDYRVWIREGFIKATQGNVADYDVIRADIGELGKLFPIREIAFDRWNATQLTTQLAGDGFTMALFGQGYASMHAPCRELEKLVTGMLLEHGENPVLRWMASNVAIEQDAAGNMKPSKDRSGEKIDGIVAGLMALARADVHKSGATPGYEVTVV
jgi:phage terminase large subunit-like protein